MESIIIQENFTTVQECLDWANGLIGEEVPGYNVYLITRIEQFQIFESYTIVVLFRVIDCR